MDELLAFGQERLLVREIDYLSLRFDGERHSVLPFDFVRIEHELVIRRIVEDRHLVRPDDDQPLFLERMQPADEDVRLDPARKSKWLNVTSRA